MKTLMIGLLGLMLVGCASTQDGTAYLYQKHDPDAECYVTLGSGKVIYLDSGPCKTFNLMADVNGNPRHEDRN